MPITVTLSGPRFADLQLDGRTLMQEIGDFALRLIRTRTEQRRDMRGNAFRALSPGYAVQKAKAGLAPLPDLTVSGRMLNDMAVVEVDDQAVTLGFTSAGGSAPRTGRGKKRMAVSTLIQRSRSIGAADKAFFHNVTGAGRAGVKREFFGLNDQDEDRIVEALDRLLDPPAA